MGVTFEYRNLIGGMLKPPASGVWLESFNPATGELLGRVPASDRDDAVEAVEAAAAAFPAWAATPPALRASYLDRVALIFEEHGDELARLESADNGTILGVSEPMNGIAMVEVWKRAAHETVVASTGQSVVLDANTFGYTRREPYGVVATIVPYNMPIAMFCVKASMALAAGNTVVAKPPEQASIGFLRLAELMVESFPPGVVNIVAGLGEVGDAFVRHEQVAKVSMTGSAATAKLIQRAAADTLTPSIFELGGKSPNIVFADADLDAAAFGVTIPSVYTFNAGQACVAGSRILIQRPVLDEMLERIQTIAESIVIGDPLDPLTAMGPLISQEQYDKVVEYLEVGQKEADLVFGGRHGAEVVPALPDGHWVEPTLFLTEDNSIRICREEIFGPVAVVIPFDTEAEAVALANDSRYGLASGVWTRDLGCAQRMVRDIQSGNVWVNSYMQIRSELPFGGIKESGYGHDTILEYTREKTAVISVTPATGLTGGSPVPMPPTL
jgi:aldehyde dehydrogenase (NAD+)